MLNATFSVIFKHRGQGDLQLRLRGLLQRDANQAYNHMQYFYSSIAKKGLKIDQAHTHTHRQKRKSCTTAHTVFENHSKCPIWNFSILAFPAIFVILKVTCLVTLFDRNFQVLKKSPKLTIFNELFATQNVKVANFARNVEWDIFCDFQTLWAR